MNRTDADRLLRAIDAAKAELTTLDDATTHFIAGAFYGLNRAEAIIRTTEED